MKTFSVNFLIGNRRPKYSVLPDLEKKSFYPLFELREKLIQVNSNKLTSLFAFTAQWQIAMQRRNVAKQLLHQTHLFEPVAFRAKALFGGTENCVNTALGKFEGISINFQFFPWKM